MTVDAPLRTPRRSRSARASDDPVVVRDLGLLGYREALAEQRRVAAGRADGTVERDELLLLQHHAVFTAGKRTEPSDRPLPGTTTLEVIDVDRGGRITWHGPGQLVGYPIMRLAEPLDVVDYVRRIEQALITVCDGYGLPVGRVAGRSGVWLPPGDGRPERKLAQIGIRVARGVTLHGFAFNVDPDLSDFGRIVPCGIADAGVTSLAIELGRPITVADVTAATTDAVLDALDGRLPVTARDLPGHDAPPRPAAPSATPTRIDLGGRTPPR